MGMIRELRTTIGLPWKEQLIVQSKDNRFNSYPRMTQVRTIPSQVYEDTYIAPEQLRIGNHV